jgi:NAD binding domain of 6-phosphogluconate dehydrogenase
VNAAHPIGFIGLGTMGEAMALTLVKAGTRLLVWNRTPAKAESFAAAGADVAREAADVFAHCATVFLMLVDGEAIGTVLDRGGAAFAPGWWDARSSIWVRPRRPIRGSSRQTFAQWADTTSKPRSLGHASPTPH